MSLIIGPAFTIPGYLTTAPPDYLTECEATVYAADGVMGHPAFWSCYLSGPINADPESEAAFEVSTAERDAMWAFLLDQDRWPAVSVRLDEDAWLRIVFRNLEGDGALNFVEERPGHPTKVFDPYRDAGCSTLTWADLIVLANLPDDRLTWAQRLILMLPMLEPQELPAEAGEVLDRALGEIGATNRPPVVATLLDLLGWRGHER
ncbi:hypothetical protein [Luedemannella flava]